MPHSQGIWYTPGILSPKLSFTDHSIRWIFNGGQKMVPILCSARIRPTGLQNCARAQLMKSYSSDPAKCEDLWGKATLTELWLGWMNDRELLRQMCLHFGGIPLGIRECLKKGAAPYPNLGNAKDRKGQDLPRAGGGENNEGPKWCQVSRKQVLVTVKWEINQSVS